MSDGLSTKRHENTVQERLSETVIRRRAKDGGRLHPGLKHPWLRRFHDAAACSSSD